MLIGFITLGTIHLHSVETTKTLEYSDIEGLEYIVLDVTETGIYIEIDGTVYFVQK